jgi:hypothetical protein
MSAARPQTRRDVDEPFAAINAIYTDMGSCPSEDLLQVDENPHDEINGHLGYMRAFAGDSRLSVTRSLPDPGHLIAV